MATATPPAAVAPPEVATASMSTPPAVASAPPAAAVVDHEQTVGGLALEAPVEASGASIDNTACAHSVCR